MADSNNKSVAEKGRRTCVAGAPNNTSCQNSQGTPGISFHTFPSGKRRADWIRFVKLHRPGWQPTSTSVLCSVHFSPEAFSQRPDINLGVDGSRARTKAWLDKSAVPTIDAVEINLGEHETTARERRQVRRNSYAYWVVFVTINRAFWKKDERNIDYTASSILRSNIFMFKSRFIIAVFLCYNAALIFDFVLFLFLC